MEIKRFLIEFSGISEISWDLLILILRDFMGFIRIVLDLKHGI
jgi:hypothetical protein